VKEETYGCFLRFSLFCWNCRQFVFVTPSWAVTSKYSQPAHPSSSDVPLPNGNTRADYHHAGFPDSAIDLWGLDQTNIPGPHSADFVIGEIADGKFDGKFDL
jgi:hypothetical protein